MGRGKERRGEGGKGRHYLDLTLKLLSQGLRGVVGEEDRMVLWEEVLFLVCSLLQTGGEDGEWRAGQTAGFLVF